jgi:hypothetical protein
MAVAINAVEQDVYPPRVLVSVTGLTLTDSIDVYRVVAGVRTLLRAGHSDSVSDPAYLVLDAELDYGVPVTYLAVVNGSDEYTAGPSTYLLDGGKPVFSDAISNNAAEVVIVAWDELSYATQASVLKLPGRNSVVSGDVGMYESSMEVFLEAGSSVANFRDLLASATARTLQLRNDLGTVSDYVAVISWRERLYSQDRTDTRRIFVLDLVQVAAWADALEASGYTYQDLADTYSAGTYSQLGTDFATYLALSQGEF